MLSFAEVPCFISVGQVYPPFPSWLRNVHLAKNCQTSRAGCP